MLHHADGDVRAVGLLAILGSPTGIEESGIYLHAVGAQLVGHLLPVAHAVAVGPQPYGALLVDERLHRIEV